MLAYIHPQSRAYQWSADVVTQQDYEDNGLSRSHRAFGRTEQDATKAAEQWAQAQGLTIVDGPDNFYPSETDRD